MSLGEAEAHRHEGQLTESVFEGYRPQRVRVAGAQPHPTKLVESAAMATVTPPKVTYRPRIPQRLINEGKLSEAQLEAIIYAGQAHQEMLPETRDAKGKPVQYRRGMFIGDGTGVGKGAEAAGIFADNWNQGRRRGVWVSKNFKLFQDAKRDWQWLGMDARHLLKHKSFKVGQPIAAATEGILFTGYGTLKTDLDKPTSRVKQIADWLGPDFDGVIVFDESHQMKNATSQKGDRGTTDASKQALAGMQLQEMLPNARVVYLSATGATEVSNLAYAQRLGMWGPDTPFTSASDFANKVASGGVAAMEIVARDMKASGGYIARQLSFDGVTQERLTHALTPEQRQDYDKLAEAWQVTLRNFNKALEITAGVTKSDGSVKIDGKAAAQARGQFWGGHQRFFNQIITSMQMPSVIRDIETVLRDGVDTGKGREKASVVLQLVNTNEASQERSLAKLEDADDLESLDMTPRDQLLELVRNSFPVAQHEQYADENGVTRMRPVLDSRGNAVENPEAVAMRDRLLSELASIRVPEGPLEMLLNHFGPDAVAEVTGRTRRVVRVRKGGTEQTVIQTWGESKALADAAAFQEGKKRILVFSNAGGTGASYHADKKAKNQQKRVHYLIQAGWVAESAVQGFGRTHRSGEVSQPIYKLVQTDLNGQKRFISTIARRLDQLGALTRGQRQAGGQGMFTELDNLESSHANDALRRLIRDMADNKVPGMDLSTFERQTGLTLMKQDRSGVKLEIPPITQFLNRLLSMNIDTQNFVFDAFMQRFADVIEVARETGQLDVGVETFRADSILKRSENVVYTDPKSEAQTKLVELEVRNRTKPTPFGAAAGQAGVLFARNVHSGKVYAFMPGPNRTDSTTGAITETYRRVGPATRDLVPKGDVEFTDRWEKLAPQAAKPLWDAQTAEVPEFKSEPLHVLTGAILPIWDKVSGKPMVRRLQTDDGERMLGRVVPEESLDITLTMLGVSAKSPRLSPREAFNRVMEDGDKLYLTGDWTVMRRRAGGDTRIEIVGPSYQHWDQLKQAGAIIEQQGYQKRVFIPTGKDGIDVLGRVLEMRTLTRVAKTAGDAPLSVQSADAATSPNAGLRTSPNFGPSGRAPLSISPFEQPPPTVGDRFELSGESTWEKIRRFVQDEFRPLRRAQEDIERQGGSVTEKSDAYLQQELFKGRAAEQVRQVEQNYVKPIVEAMTRAKLTVEDVDKYLYALHARERNRQIALINPDMPDGGSGMTNDEAAAAIEDIENGPKAEDYRAIAELVHDLNDQTLTRMVDSGLLAPEAADSMRSTYRHYVPLRTDMEQDGLHNLRPGQGFDIRGIDSNRAMGRRSLADSPLTFSVMQAQEKIIRSEKNRVGQALLKLVRENPDPRLWQIDPVHMRQGLDPQSGQVVPQMDKRFQYADHVVAVKERGETRLIEFHGDAGRIARAMKRLGYQDGGVILQWLNRAMRLYANLQTNWNPEFLLPNLVRDLQTASINLGAEQSREFAWGMLKGMPKSAKATFDVLGDDTAGRGSEYHDYVREYRAAGGKVDAYAVGDFAATSKQVAKLLKDANPSKVRRLLLAMRKGGEFIDRLNATAETAARLSAYVQARKAGASPARAASLAKNLTVNFNRKGEWGTAINSLYLFANASIQGNVRLAKALVKSKAGRRIGAGIFLTGLAYGLFAPLLFGEDEEGRDVYDTIPDPIKATNFLIPTGGGNYLKLPLPYGFNAVFGAGRVLGEAGSGRQSPARAGVNIVTTGLQAFNPLGTEGSLLQTLMPTAADPLVQFSENKDWAGLPITPQQSPFGPPKPDSALSRRDTSPYTKAVAEWLNRLTGGDEVSSGTIDVAPTTLDHFLGWAAGGTGRFVTKIAELPGRIAGGDVPSYTVPIASRFVGEPPEGTNQREFYDILRGAEDALADVRYYEQHGEDDKAVELRQAKARDIGFARYAEHVRKQGAVLRKQMDATEDVAEKRRIKEQMDALMGEFVKNHRQGNLPQRWAFENELATLRAKRRAFNAARGQLQNRKADRTAVLASLRKHRLTPREEARLKRLNAIDNSMSKIEKRVELGQLREEIGERQIQRLAAAA